MKKEIFKIVAACAAAIAILVGVVTAWGSGKALDLAITNSWCDDILVAAQETPSADVVAYRDVEYQACIEARGDATPRASEDPTATAEPTANPSASPSAPATPTAGADDKDDNAQADDASREIVFYATLGGKVGDFAHGPQRAQDPALGGAYLEGLTAQQFLQEMSFRVQRDPALTASFYLAVIEGKTLDDTQEVDALTERYLADYSAWDKAVNEIRAAFDAALAGGATTQHFGAGWYATTYMIPSSAGDMAFVRTNASIWRSGEAYILVNGVAIRYACGGQPYWLRTSAGGESAAVDIITTMPEPSPGMAITDEGTPYVPSGDGNGGTPPSGGGNPPENTATPTPGGGEEPPTPVPPKENENNAGQVEQPDAGETQVDDSRPGQGISEEPQRGSSDLGNTGNGAGDAQEGQVSDGNTSDLANQGGAEGDAVGDGGSSEPAVNDGVVDDG